MAIYDRLTGADISLDGASTGYKKMCLNCKSCSQVPSTIGTTLEMFSCVNEKVLETGRKKILESVPEGFEVTNLEIGPMKLKNPTKKCPNHEFSMESVVEYLNDYFGENSNSENSEKPSEG